MVDLFLPATDGGVLLQAIVLALASGLGLWLTRQRTDLRLVVIGVALLGFGFIGLRALH